MGSQYLLPNCKRWMFPNKEIELVVEVDGSQHKEAIQAERDSRKDRLLKEAGIKILRLSTTAIECREKIVQMLNEDRD